MKLVLLGAPGAGKGTQAQILSEKLGILHISTGDIMRKAVAKQSPLGKKIKAFIDMGALVPDNLVIELIRERLCSKGAETGFLLDGFPRTLEQARALDRVLDDLLIALDGVVEIQVPEELLKERLIKRGKESGRSDDSETVIANRLEVYRKQTVPVSDFYRSKGVLREIDGVGTVDEVNSRINQQLG